MLECAARRWGRNCENICRCEECDSVVGCLSCGALYAGWTGPNCDDDIDECEDAARYCGANADCHNINGSYTCQCHPWYQPVSARCVRMYSTFAASAHWRN